MAEHGNGGDEPGSPVCMVSEFADELLPPSADWAAVQTMRKSRREQLLAARRALPPEERRRCASELIARLGEAVDLRAYAVLGFYWPIRAELDLRPVAERHVEAGGQAALPVVVEKNRPVEFWQWRPRAAMQRGLWNIPVPAERRVLAPDALLIPLVGYDAAGYRLGYGGGYYDRTLAAAKLRPLCIGVAYDSAEIPTIEPRSHDIPMDIIVTERRVLRFDRGSRAQR